MFFYTSTEVKEYVKNLPRNRKSALYNYFLTHTSINTIKTARHYCNNPTAIKKVVHYDILVTWLKKDFKKQISA